jgi:hypothetical protein
VGDAFTTERERDRCRYLKMRVTLAGNERAFHEQKNLDLRESSPEKLEHRCRVVSVIVASNE